MGAGAAHEPHLARGEHARPAVLEQVEALEQLRVMKRMLQANQEHLADMVEQLTQRGFQASTLVTVTTRGTTRLQRTFDATLGTVGKLDAELEGPLVVTLSMENTVLAELAKRHLPGAVQPCGVGIFVWSTVLAYNAEGDAPSTDPNALTPAVRG